MSTPSLSNLKRTHNPRKQTQTSLNLTYIAPRNNSILVISPKPLPILPIHQNLPHQTMNSPKLAAKNKSTSTKLMIGLFSQFLIIFTLFPRKQLQPLDFLNASHEKTIISKSFSSSLMGENDTQDTLFTDIPTLT